MTDETYLKEIIREMSDMKASLANLAEKFSERMTSLEDKITANIEITKGQMKGKYELLEQEVNGMSKRVDDKIQEHEAKLHELAACEASCTAKRKDIHDKIDTLRDDRITPLTTRVEKLENYLKAAWVVIGFIGASVGAVGVVLLERVL